MVYIIFRIIVVFIFLRIIVVFMIFRIIIVFMIFWIIVVFKILVFWPKPDYHPKTPVFHACTPYCCILLFVYILFSGLLRLSDAERQKRTHNSDSAGIFCGGEKILYTVPCFQTITNIEFIGKSALNKLDIIGFVL